MEFRFTPITAAEARAILAWRYEPPHDSCDVPHDRQESQLVVMLDPRNGYHAARRGEETVGFCAFGPDARAGGGDYRGEGVLDVGLGLRPDLTGRGIGPSFVGAALAFGAQAYSPQRFRMTVASFNRRAIRVHERLGFRVESTFKTHCEDGGEVAWTVMSRDADRGLRSPAAPR